MVRKTRRKTSCERSIASSRSPSRFIASCTTIRWCSATSSAQADSSPAPHRCTSAASRPPTSDQLTALACFTERSTIPRLDPGRARKFLWAGRIEPIVKRSIVVLAVLALVAVSAAVAYQAAARQQDYGAALIRGDNALRD